MAPTATVVPVARPRYAAAGFLPTELRTRSVVAEAIGVAFAIRTDAAAAATHDLDITALLLAR